MPGPRTKCVSTKVTDEEYATLERLAGHRSLSEWVRGVLLSAVDAQPATDPVVLAELLALRTIVVNVQYALATGDPFTADEMRDVIRRADRDKDGLALQRLATAPTPTGR
jgi:hypothetical protein